jgi:hypothetical protein
MHVTLLDRDERHNELLDATTRPRMRHDGIGEGDGGG